MQSPIGESKCPIEQRLYRHITILVDLNGPRSPTKLLGGFSDVSGLETDIHISEYRDGNEAEPHVRKIPGSHKVGDVTLKRGVVNSSDLWDWITATRTTGVAAQRDVVITLLDEVGQPGAAVEAAQRGADEVHRPHAGGQGRRRGRHGRAGAIGRRLRNRYRHLLTPDGERRLSRE